MSTARDRYVSTPGFRVHRPPELLTLPWTRCWWLGSHDVAIDGGWGMALSDVPGAMVWIEFRWCRRCGARTGHYTTPFHTPITGYHPGHVTYDPDRGQQYLITNHSEER